MHSTTICGSSLHVTIHLEAKNFWAKRKNKRMRANKNPKKRKNCQKEKRNEKPAAHNNDERSQAAKLVSKITLCVYLPVCVCVCVRVCSLFTLLLRHAWPQARTNFLLLPQLPPYYAQENQPHQSPTPKSHHPQLNPIRLNSTVNRAEQNSSRESRPVSHASCLEPRLSFHHHLWQWLAAGTGSKNMKTLPQIHNAPKKNNKLNLPYILRGYWASWYPGKGPKSMSNFTVNVLNALASFNHSEMICKTVSRLKVSHY